MTNIALNQYHNTHILLNLLNELRKSDTRRAKHFITNVHMFLKGFPLEAKNDQELKLECAYFLGQTS